MCNSVSPNVGEILKIAPQSNLDVSVISVSSMLPFETIWKAVETLQRHQYICHPSQLKI